jgi:hypothetical protein
MRLKIMDLASAFFDVQQAETFNDTNPDGRRFETDLLGRTLRFEHQHNYLVLTLPISICPRLSGHDSSYHRLSLLVNIPFIATRHKALRRDTMGSLNNVVIAVLLISFFTFVAFFGRIPAFR